MPEGRVPTLSELKQYGRVAVDIGTPVARGQYFLLRQVYQYRDASKVQQNLAKYVKDWNGRYRHRVNVLGYEMSGDLLYCWLMGVSGETVGQLGLSNCWGQLHIEGVHDYDLMQLLNPAENQQGNQPGGAPPGGTPAAPAAAAEQPKPKPEPVLWPYFVGGGLLLAGAGYLYLRKRRGGR